MLVASTRPLFLHGRLETRPLLVLAPSCLNSTRKAGNIEVLRTWEVELHAPWPSSQSTTGSTAGSTTSQRQGCERVVTCREMRAMQPELLAVIHVSTACCVLQYYVRAQVNRSTSQQSPMQGQARRRFVPTPQFVQLRSILRLCAPSFNVTADIALQYHGITLPRACVRCVDVSQRHSVPFGV